MSFFTDLFKPPKTLQERVKEMQTSLTKEMRNMDRQILKIQTEEKKLKIEAKKLAKQNNTECVKMLAKQIIHTRKTSNRLFRTKTQINSVIMQLTLQLSQINVTKSLQKSGQIMKMMNSLCKVPVIAGVMQNLSREMIKMNLIEETINDAMDDVFDDVSDGEIDEEVSKVVDELMMSIKENTHLPTSNLPIKEEIIQNNQEEIKEDENLEDRLNKLKTGAD